MLKFLLSTVLIFFAISFENCFGQFTCPKNLCDIPQCKNESNCGENELYVPTWCSCCNICAVKDGKLGDPCGYGTCAQGLVCINSQCCRKDYSDEDSVSIQESVTDNSEVDSHEDNWFIFGGNRGKLGYDRHSDEVSKNNRPTIRNKRWVKRGWYPGNSNEDSSSYADNSNSAINSDSDSIYYGNGGGNWVIG